MKNYSLIKEHPDHFVLHNGVAHFKISKSGLSEPTADKIRALAKGGEISKVDPNEALNQYVPEKGIVGGTVRDGSDEERFHFGKFTFDIDKARDISKQKANTKIPVSSKWLDKIKIDKEAAMRGTSDNPVFIAQIHTPHGLKFLLIDGNHRMHRAVESGEKTIPAYVFTPEQSISLLTDKYPKDELKKSSSNGSVKKMAAGGKISNKQTPQNYDEGGPVTIDPDKAQSISDSFKGAVHSFDQGGKVQNYYDTGDVEKAGPPQATSSPDPTPEPTPAGPLGGNPFDYNKHQHILPTKAKGGPVTSNSIKDISHETQSQAIGRYAAGNPANLSKGGSTHHTQGKYHFHFYDGGPVTHSDKYPDAPPTPLDNYVNQAEPTGTVGEDAADQGVQLNAQDVDPNAPINLPNSALPETPLQQQMDASAQPAEAPSATDSANNLARAMGKDLPFPNQDQGVIPSSQQISLSKPTQQTNSIPDKSDMLTQLNADITGEQNAVLGGKQAEAQGFAAQSQAIQSNIAQQNKANIAYQTEVDNITKQNTDLFNNVRNDTINPNQFWDNKSTGGKIAAGIALLLGGASSGLTGRSNPALDIIQKSIQNDIEAQKNNQAQGVNLYKLGLEKYRDAQSAHQYATLQANAILQGQLSKIASQTGSQTAPFQAQQAIHQIGLQNAELRSSLGLRQAAIQSMNAQPTNQTGIDLNKSRLLTMAGVIPKEEQSNIDKESEDYQKLSNYNDEVDNLFKNSGANATYTERIAQGIPGGSMIPTTRDSTKEYLAQTNAFLDKATKDLTGRVTPQSMENLKHSMPVAGDSPAVTQSKINTLKDIGRSGYHFPTLQKYTLLNPNDPVSTLNATRQKRFTEGPAK